MASQPIVQWNYIIYFRIRGSVFNNIQGLFILNIGYEDMTTYPLTKYYYIIERAYFIYKFFILFISSLSFFLVFYIQYHGGIREITSMPV